MAKGEMTYRNGRGGRLYKRAVIRAAFLHAGTEAISCDLSPGGDSRTRNLSGVLEALFS